VTSSRPYVLLSAAVSLDGYLDDASPSRLLLSNTEDFDRVDQVRASADAILVGAATIRADDPALEVRSLRLRQKRLSEGLSETPLKVTLSKSGRLDPGARFFGGDGGKLVFVPSRAFSSARDRIGSPATVIDAGSCVDLDFLLRDLAARGVARLMVEGGGAVHTLFLSGGVVDEIQIAVAPFLLGSAGGQRFVNPARFPQDPAHRMDLAGVRQLGDVVVLRYLVRS
jgi:5-amino-6-(5-phosphoribosylamino)uracil reductase